MADDYEVEPDDLVAHASHVDALVDRLQTAQQAAGTALSEHAYGLLCAFLPPIVNPTGEQAKDTIGAAMEGVRGMADNVRMAAQAYRDSEQENAAPFKLQLGDDTGTAAPYGRIGTTTNFSVGAEQ